MTPAEVFSKMRIDMNEVLCRSVGEIPEGCTVRVMPSAKAVFAHEGDYYYGHIVDGVEVVEKLESTTLDND
jgi:hypothetical protein